MMNTKKHTRALGLAFLLAIAATAAIPKQVPAAGIDTTWYLSGYLPSDPGRKVWLTIKGEKIAAVGATAPVAQAGVLIIDTENLIFPGLVDMHNHIKYNVMNLWSRAKGQFLNRFEWRTVYSPYSIVHDTMVPINADPTTLCAAVRWAEIKSLTGGVTTMQGIGTDTKCAGKFGPRNIEGSFEFGVKVDLGGTTDMVFPSLLGDVYEPLIRKHMPKSPTTFDNPDTADQAYLQAYSKYLAEAQIQDWLTAYRAGPFNPEKAVELLFGQIPQSLMGTMSFSSDDQMKGALAGALMSAPYSLKQNKADTTAKAMVTWIKKFQEGARKPPNDRDAVDALSMGAVIQFQSSVRRYPKYQERSRANVIANLKKGAVRSYIVHLAEGMQKDKYNAMEYPYAKEMGLTRKGFVVIHGVGMTSTDFMHARRNNVSLVWSPFSNLLLYGETLNVSAAFDAGVNIALGADWSPTGSKNLLDELKIARRYLNKMKISQSKISDRHLVEMATLNAAKALGMDDVLGSVTVGKLADLVLIQKQGGSDPYSALVQAGQDDINLVVVGGQPVYGNSDLIAKSASTLKDVAQPEDVLSATGSAGKCSFKKSMRLPFKNQFDSELGSKYGGVSPLLSVKRIYEELNTKMGTVEKTTSANLPDPLYGCQDDAYTTRFNRFIEQELDENARNRLSLRSKERLRDDFSPMKVDTVEE